MRSVINKKEKRKKKGEKKIDITMENYYAVL
jgi:hypothetical protein